MTIKAKLIANVLVIAAIILCISQASYVSMSFLQKKLSYLTDKSTPFQMQTVGLQSDLQTSVTDLISVNSARNMAEFTTFRAKALQSLENVHNSQKTLVSLNGRAGQAVLFEELNDSAQELISATDARIKSDMAATEANAGLSRQMKDSTLRLKELEATVRALQNSHAESFAQALKRTESHSANLRNLEELRNTLKELHAASESALNARKVSTHLISKGKIKTLMGRVTRNKSITYISPRFKTLEVDIDEFLQLVGASVSRNDEESKKWMLESFAELTEFINRLNLELNQEIELASSRLAIESQRQGTIFGRSNDANTVLLANSELVALGLTVTSEANRLFTLNSPEELDNAKSSILTAFSTIDEHVRYMERSLGTLEAKNVVSVLNSAHSSLVSIRSELISANGIVNTLKTKLDAIKQANSSADKLHDIVVRQSAKGKENISLARGDQSKAVNDVYSMINRSLIQTIGIGTVAILVGILFGLWIYRSVLQPLRTVLDAVRSQQQQGEEKALLLEAVAGGDLNRNVVIGEPLPLDKTRIPNDEIGMVLKAVVSMSEAQVTLDRACGDMTASLRRNQQEEARRSRIKNGLFDLTMILRDEQITGFLAEKTLAYIADFLSAGVGIMYQFDAVHEVLHPVATYAVSTTGLQNVNFKLGEGLVGQAALERKSICLDSVPPNYLTITSALGAADPLHVTIMPIQYNDTLIGVLELGSFMPFSPDDTAFLQQSLEGIAIALNINHARQLVDNLLIQTQQQAEELLQTNEELEERTELQTELQRAQRAPVRPA